MYSIQDFGRMIGDRTRMDAYARALKLAVKPGCVVADLGTGTGIFALLACQYGARKVYAIEPSDAIHTAREIAAARGLADRIEFIQALSTDIPFKERADVVVSDMHGALPLFGRHLPSIADARNRILAPGGILIPQRDTVWVTVAQIPQLFARDRDPWFENPTGFKMPEAWTMVANTSFKFRIKPEEMFVEPQQWATIDYTTVEIPDVTGELNWQAEHGGHGHGLVAWFDAVLQDGIGYSNAPSAPELVYGHLVFPWPEPVAIARGDRIKVSLKARLQDDEYVWCWDTTVRGPGEAGPIKANFRQSTFFGSPLSPDALRKGASDFKAQLKPDGRILRAILNRFETGQTLEEIAQSIRAEFPDRFPGLREALAKVSDISVKFSR